MTGSIQMIQIICLPAQVARIVSFFSGLPRVAWLCPFFSCSICNTTTLEVLCWSGRISKSSRSRLYPRPNQHLLEIPKFPVASAGARALASTLNTTGISRRLRTRQWNHLPPLTLSPQILVRNALTRGRIQPREYADGSGEATTSGSQSLRRLRRGIRTRVQPISNMAAQVIAPRSCHHRARGPLFAPAPVATYVH